MATWVVNEPQHPWYQRRNHVRIPRAAESRGYLDADWTGAGGGAPAWTEAAFPVALMQPGVQGYVYDPAHPLNNTLSTGAGTIPVIGDPVGRVAGFNPDLADINLTQATAASRPLLVERGGKPGWQFDGVAQNISVANVAVGDWVTVPRSMTQFAMLWRDVAAPASDTNPFAISRGEVSDSYLRFLALNSTLGLRGRARLGGTVFVNDLVGLPVFPVGQWVEVIVEFTATQMSVASVGASSGTLTYWIGEAAPVVHPILPDRVATTNITLHNRAILGAQFASTTVQQFFAGVVGRSGFFYRALDDAQRASLRNWMRGTTYIAP